MATINHSSGSDVIVPSNNGYTYRGLAGDDIYIISDAVAANAKITIVDTSGNNKIQLIDGLIISSAKLAATAAQLTLSNGAIITINGAHNFIFEISGNATTSAIGTNKSYEEFAIYLGFDSLPTKGTISSDSSTVIGEEKTPNQITFSTSKSSSSVTEGEDITITITSSSPVLDDTTFSYTVSGSTNDSTVQSADDNDFDVLSGTVTIPAGDSSSTFPISINDDEESEPIEGARVTISGSNVIFLEELTFLIDSSDNSSSSEDNADVVGTDGDDNLTLTKNDDNYEVTTGKDTVNGAEGDDTIIVLRGTKVIKSQDVFGGITGITNKTYLQIQLEDETDWTYAYNFEKLLVKGDDTSTLIDDYFSSSRWDVSSKSIDDLTIEDNTTKEIDLSDSFWTWNADTTMEYSIDFLTSDKVSDQITLSGSNLSIKGGNGGDRYTVTVTVRGTQKFSDNFNFSTSDFNYDDQIFNITLSDDDYIEGQTGTSSDDNITLSSNDDSYEFTFGVDKIDGGAGSDTFIINTPNVSIVRAIDVKGEDAYTGIVGKEFLYIIHNAYDYYTIATNFEIIKFLGESFSLDAFDSYTYLDVRSWRNDTEGVKLEDLIIENNEAKTLNLDNNFFTINKDASLSYTIDISNDKVSDQISISGSNLNIQGGVGGDKYEVKVTVRATQTFSNGIVLSNEEINYEEDSFIVTLSDDDYIAVNASTNITPNTSSSLTDVSVTEDIIGGVLLDLKPLNIDKGTAKIVKWGPNLNNSPDLADDYLYIDEDVLKLRDNVTFNTDRSELINLETYSYFVNQTSGQFDIIFDYESNGVNKRHTLQIKEFIDTIYGSGIYGDGNYLYKTDEDFSYPSDTNIKSLIGLTHWINTSSNSSEVVEIFYSFVTKDSQNIRDSSSSGGYRSTDPDDVILDPTEGFKSAVKEILQDTESIFKIKFTELTGDNVDKASIRYVLWDSPSADASGYSWLPSEEASFIFILKPDNNDFSAGTFTYGTIRHETGHALGLVHPFEGNLIDSEFNSLVYTIMSYSAVYDTLETNSYDSDSSGSFIINRSSGKSTDSIDWQIYDIAALKHIYGLRSDYNIGDNTYSFTAEPKFQNIHDLGGYDTIDLSASTSDNDIKFGQIDLNGGAVFQVGNFQLTWSGDQYQTGQVITTSLDTKIEKFIGSSGIDNVILGETSDTILTNGGDDKIFSVGIYKSASSIRIDAGSGDDYVNVFIDTDEVNSLLDIDGGIGYDYVVIYNNETEIDFSLYLKHFDSFENFQFRNSSPQNITIDEEDFIELSGTYLGISAGDEDTIILPEGAEEDTSIINDYYDYYVLNDITIAISDNSLIG